MNIENILDDYKSHIQFRLDTLNVTLTQSGTYKIYYNDKKIYETSGIDSLCSFLDGIDFERHIKNDNPRV